jgi:hypothetical protein
MKYRLYIAADAATAAATIVKPIKAAKDCVFISVLFSIER